MLIRLLAAALLLSLAVPNAAHDPLEILTLRYRTAADVLPLLEPLLEGHGAITGTGAQIFVRASPERIARVKDAILKIDVEPRDLWISVRQIFERRRSRRAREADAEINPKAIDLPNTWGDRGFSGFEDAVQAVRGLEGREAFIEIRRDLPVRRREAIVTADSAAIIDDWFFEALGTGFYVVPHLVQDRFTLELVTRHTPEVGLPRREHELRTSVSGDLGRWIEVGHVLEEHAYRMRGPLSPNARDERTEHSVVIKVDIIDRKR
jgi:hypothetical protein